MCGNSSLLGADQVMLVYGDTKKQDSQLVLLHWQYSSINVLDVGISMSKGGTHQESLWSFLLTMLDLIGLAVTY